MEQNIALAVINAFEGQTKLARAINVPISTVDSWRRSGKIPAWRRPVILAAAKKGRVELPGAFAAEREDA